jgi:uncharacterized protein YicC (UPF0701 family)
MSVYSMTGYASVSATASEGPVNDADHAGPAFASKDSAREAARDANGPSATVELRSVNSRFLDIVMRLPDEARGLEPTLRELIAARLRRGKVELRLIVGVEGAAVLPAPRTEQLSRLAALQDTVHTWLPKAAALSVHEVLGWCRHAAPVASSVDVVLAAARRALDQLMDSRATEGERLARSLQERIAGLRRLADEAEPLVPELVKRQQARFLERFQAALASVEASPPSPTPPTSLAQALPAAQERALSEAASFAIRIDVAEEITRLRSHLDALDALLAKGGEIGKRMDFLIQELLREANTLGSKASSLELTNLSVEMKVLIEQMREQVQNIE